MKNNHSFVLLLAISILSSAVTIAQPVIRLKAGGIRSQWRGDGLGILNSLGDATKNNLFSQQGLTSYYIGGSVDWPIGEHFSIEPALQYSRTGATLQGNFAIKALSLLGLGLEARAVTQRIELPVLLKAEIVEGLQLVAGPQVNYAFDNKLHLQGKVLGINLLNETMSIDAIMEPFTVAAVGGVQYHFANGFQLQGIYEYGLSRIAKNNKADIYQHTFRIGMGIPINRKG